MVTKRRADRKFEKKEKELWGKGTIVLNSWKEFEKIEEEFNSQLTSPGGAAGRLGVSRAYIHQLEKEGKIRAYRIWGKDMLWEHYPPWIRWLAPQKEVYIFIPDVDIERVRTEMLKQAKARIKKLEGR